MIGVLTNRKDIVDSLSEVIDVYMFDDGMLKVDGVFIDWIPQNENDPEFARQALIVEEYAKANIPIVIFDRYMAMTIKEYNWLKNFSVSFFEPAINHRDGFKYMPQWTTGLPDDWWRIKKENRTIDLGYKGLLKDKIGQFEKYYVEFKKLYPKYNTLYVADDRDNIEVKPEEWNDYDVIFTNRFSWSNTKNFVLIDSKHNYRIGHLRDDIFDIMLCGCVPMIPREHKYFASMFSISFDNIKDMSFFMSTSNKIKEPLIAEIFENIDRYFPEFKIENTRDRILRCINV